MKKALPLIIVLVLLLVLSIGGNVFLLLDKFVLGDGGRSTTSTLIKYGDKKITKQDFMDDIISTSGTDYISKLKDKVILADLREDEIDDVEDTINETMSSLEENYGDELETAIRTYTSYSTKQEYKDYMLYNEVLNKRAEKKCDGEESDNCRVSAYYEEMLRIMKDSDITFNNDELKKKWDEEIKNIEYALKQTKEASGESGQTPSEEYTSIKEISFSELEEMIAKKKTFVLMITRTTCGYCQMFKPVMDSIANKFNKTFYYIETDHISEEEVGKLYEIMPFDGTPTTGIFKNGKLKDSMVGYREESEATEFLKAGGAL